MKFYLLVKRLEFKSVKQFIPGLSIAQKIGYGYAIAIGISILGTTVGSIVSQSYEVAARRNLLLAEEQIKLLYQLDNAILKLRLHPQELTKVVGDAIWFEYETSKFLSHVKYMKKNLDELNTFASKKNQRLSTPPKRLNSLAKDYEQITDSYSQLIQSFWPQVNPHHIKNQDKLEIQEYIFAEMMAAEPAKQLGVKFEQLSESLSQIIQEAEKEQAIANQNLIKAESLRKKIILGSMLVSVAIAVFLAIFTSRGIARPLKRVTEVAQRVTKEENFQLKAPVITQDEVGSLATSLNQMIEWMHQYTDELEVSRITLEHRVEQRTADLEAALKNLKQTQAKLIQTEKMSSLGQMVAGVAHEINNPVNFIYANLIHLKDYTEDLFELIEIYEKKYSDNEIEEITEKIDWEYIREDLPKIIKSMSQGTDRIKGIVLSLRNFSRLDESKLKKANIKEGIENTLLMLNNRFNSKIKLIKQYSELPLVYCYPAQLNQVFMHSIANALDAVEEKKAEDAEILIKTEKLDGDRVRIRVKDNGAGIPDEIKDKLFDPFFTTKPVGKGTGLGLSICYGIIQQHHGTIEINSVVGEGTEFVINLPIEFIQSAAT